MKKSIIFISEIVVDVSLIPFFFIKLFREVGHFPAEGSSDIYEKIFYFSILDNLKAIDYETLVYVGIALILASVFLSSISIISKENKNLRLVAHIFFGFSLILFFILLALASTVARGY